MYVDTRADADTHAYNKALNAHDTRIAWKFQSPRAFAD